MDFFGVFFLGGGGGRGLNLSNPYLDPVAIFDLFFVGIVCNQNLKTLIVE